MLWYIVFRFAGFLAQHLPERLGRAIARRIGAFVYRVSPLAEATRDNARHVFGPEAGPEKISAAAQKAFQNRVINIYEMLWLSRLPLDAISARTETKGLEYVEQQVQRGQGAVLVSGHVGPIEHMIQALASYGYPIFGMVEHLQLERLHQFVMNVRAAHGLELLTTQDSLLEVYRRVKRGDMLLSMVDRDSTDSGLIVDFFGEPAWMPDGYARLAVRAGVPVILGYCVRTERGVMMRICPPIYPDRSLSKEAAVLDVIYRTLCYLEEAIHANPGEWHLSAPIWQLAQERRQRGKHRENCAGITV